MELLRRYENSRLDERFSEYLLAGRMRAVVHEKPGFRRSFVLAIARFGGADLMLPDGTPIPLGVAHFFEHRMFSKLDGDISRRFANLGMSVNAATGHSRTAYHASGSGELVAGVELMLELVFSPHFPADGVESERQIIGREIAENEQFPGTKLVQMLHESLYHAHPVRHEILGSRETLGDITPTLLYRCHETFYCPENVIFFLYGHGDEPAALAVIERYLSEELATIGGRPVPLARVEEPDSIVRRRAEAVHRVSRPQIAMAWKASCDIPTGQEYLESVITTQVVLDLLFGSSSEWFERSYSAGVLDESFEASYPHDADYGYLLVGGETGDPDGFEATVRARIASIHKSGFAAADLDRVKRRLAGNYLRQFNTPEEALGLFANFLVVDADALECAEIAENLTLAGVTARAEEIFDEERSVTALLRPASSRRAL